MSYPSLLEKNHPFRQWKSWAIPGTALSVSGYSRANDKTFFHLPSLRASIDAGLCEGREVETVFLTHTHADHSYDIEYLSARAGGVDIYAPAASLPYIERSIRSKRELNFSEPFNPDLASGYRLHGVEGEMRFSFGKKGEYEVRVFACQHKVPCVGYCFSARQRRLLPPLEAEKQALEAAGQLKEFGARMAARRRAGEETHEELFAPRFAFLGDTHPQALLDSPWVFDYPVIFTECTFLDDAEAERAERVGHTVWSKLRPLLEAHPKNLFVLTHFSLRHSDREVSAFFAREKLPNVLAWAHPEGLLPEQHQHR